MNWNLTYLPEAKKDMKRLDGRERLLVQKALEKVWTNPLPVYDRGYGKPLGNKDGRDLTGLLKIKLKQSGIRVIYKLIQTETEMLVLVVGARADEAAYRAAWERRKKYGL